MWPKFRNSSISVREVIIASILYGFHQKNRFFEEWSWFKFNNLGLGLGTNVKFCTRGEKVLKWKVRKFRELIPMSVKVTGRKLIGGAFPPPILNRVNSDDWCGCKVGESNGMSYTNITVYYIFNNLL